MKVGLLADGEALGVIASDRLAAWPDRRLGIMAPDPVVDALRAGIRVDFENVPFTRVARLDLAEPWRPYVDDRVGPLSGALIDDAYVIWRPARPIQLILGRERVPFTKPRQIEEIDEPFGAAPFVVDRIAPDRRWGLTAYGDLGAISYAGGVYEDLDSLEPRERTGDPSQNGAVALAAHLEWTPRAPMNGSNPPGEIIGSQGQLTTPRKDPWLDVSRNSFGAGVLYRIREDGTRRLDVSVSKQLKLRWFAFIIEALVSQENGGSLTGGGHLDLMATPIDRLALLARGEYDGGAPNGGEWTAEAGVAWHVTPDRRNKLELLGWLRRDVDRQTPYDALVLLFQASL